VPFAGPPAIITSTGLDSRARRCTGRWEEPLPTKAVATKKGFTSRREIQFTLPHRRAF